MKLVEVQYYEHTCKCGCGSKIEIKQHHKWYGIPEHIKGHNKSTFGMKFTEEHKIKLSEAHKGQFVSEETKIKIGLKSKGRSQTIEAKQKISLANKGKKRTEEQIKNISNAIKGKSRGNPTEETKYKIKIGNIGKKRSEETKQNISESKKGFKHSEETKQKLSDINKLEKHPQWQDGISFEPYSPEFNKEKKQQILERDNYTCQNPNCKLININLVVHHIDYNKKNNLNENLITLCNICNVKANFNRMYFTEFYQNIMRIKCNLELL